MSGQRLEGRPRGGRELRSLPTFLRFGTSYRMGLIGALLVEALELREPGCGPDGCSTVDFAGNRMEILGR